MTMEEILKTLFEPGGILYGIKGDFHDEDTMEPHESSCGLGGRKQVKAQREKWLLL